MRMGLHPINVWGSVLVLVATNWWARECLGSSWIVASTSAAAAPSCPSYCLQGFTGVRAGNMVGLWWCCGLGTRFVNEHWSFDNDSSAIFLKDAQESPFCLDIADAATIIDDTPLPAPSARSLVLSNCDPSSPTQKWTFEAGHLKSLAGSKSSYAYPYQTHQNPGVFFLYLVEETVSAQSFVMVDIDSVMASYYTPALPANNQSNLILNGNLKMLTSFAPLTQPPLGAIETDWITAGVWDGLYFVLCHWEVHGNQTINGCSSSKCELPKEWCSGNNANETLFFLNAKDANSGWIMQTVPSYPGSNYLLLFETRNPRNQKQKLQLSVSQVLTSSANRTASKEFEIFPNQTESQTHQFQFIASGNFINVSFATQETYECGPLINNIQLYYWPLAAEPNVVQPDQVSSAGRLSLAVTIVGWVVAATQCSGITFYIASNLWRRKRRGKLIGSSANTAVSLQVQITVFSYEQLKAYTENFSMLVGEGGFGKVYFGRLPQSHQAIAVKRQNDADDVFFFRAEVALLSRVHHRYIVKFLGYCEDKGERMLVFEFMPKKSLHSRLHGESMLAAPLSWEERLRIVYQVAYALEYLHNGASPPVLHRDVKSANVLLSDALGAKLADLGISKAGRPNELVAAGTTSTMTAVKGSRGYLDPYYLQTSKISYKSDVYSFGVLLLETVTGRKVITSDVELVTGMTSNVELLTTWAKRVYWDFTRDGDEGIEQNILDSRLRGTVSDANVKAVMEIARSCLYEEPRLRPCMLEVTRRLREQLASVTHLHMDELNMGTDLDAASSSNNTSIFSGR